MVDVALTMNHPADVSNGGIKCDSGASPKPFDGDVIRSDSDDEKDDEGIVGGSELQECMLPRQLLVLPCTIYLTPSSFEKEKEKEEAKKKKGRCNYQQGPVFPSTGPFVNAFPK